MRAVECLRREAMWLEGRGFAWVFEELGGVTCSKARNEDKDEVYFCCSCWELGLGSKSNRNDSLEMEAVKLPGGPEAF